jgi:hypothetical protein
MNSLLRRFLVVDICVLPRNLNLGHILRPSQSQFLPTPNQHRQDHNIITPETYSQQQLKDLVQSHWNLATAWTYDQYASAQNSFADVRESTFDAWDESRLHEFLREQGGVAPEGLRECARACTPVSQCLLR